MLSVFAVCALAVVSSADAKLNPTLSVRVAVPDQRVVLNFGEGARAFQAPLEVYLVRRAIDPRVRSRDDRRLYLVGRLGREGKPITTDRLAFRVPRVPAGDYMLAIWFKGSETKRWHRLATGRRLRVTG